jgi:hypothetical protein
LAEVPLFYDGVSRLHDRLDLAARCVVGMDRSDMYKQYSIQTGRLDRWQRNRRRGLIGSAVLVAAGAVLASCNTPVGVSPGLQGTYWEHAQVTNPNGGGPQVVRWGPPQNYNPGADNP